MTHLPVTQTEVVIGPFRRQMFAEGLAIMLRSEANLNLTRIATEAEVTRFLNNSHPTIVILEARAREAARAPLPESDAVAVILIAQEGRDVQIALRQFDRNRLSAAIGMVSKAPHPRVITLDAEGPAQPSFALPKFRDPQASGLGTVIAWLDAVFVLAMAEYESARGPDGPASEDAAILRTEFERGQTVSRAEVQRRFEALEDAPMWQVRLRRTFGLDATELKLLCLAAAPDLDHRYAQVIGLMQNDYAQGRPNATTLARLLGRGLIGADIDAVLAGRRNFARLRMIRPVESAQPQPGFRIAPSLLDLMIGARRLAAPGWRLQRRGLPPQQALSDQVAAYLALPNPPVLLCGQEKHGADEVAAALVENGAPVLRVQVAELTGDVAEAVADWALIARLQDAVLMFEGLQSLPEPVQVALSAADTATLVRSTVLIGSTAPVPEGRDAVHLSIGRPGPAVQARRWQIAGAENGLTLSTEEAERLGGVLRLGLGDVAAVIAMAAGHRRLGARDAPEALVLKAATRVATQHAPETVRRPDCIFDWDDIVLPEQIKTMVQSVPDHVRHASLVLDHWGFAARLPYGRGVGAFFAGPSGTGKTMCAQVIARALGVELMQVELARCVSKYIGETEKNIDRCFEAAETASAVLLF
ncbi:MAG: AAA family ATPase, partial [Paracoccaceae bacterium]